MKKLSLMIALALLPTAAVSDSFKDLDNAVTELNKPAYIERAEFLEWHSNHLAEFANWRKEYIKKWDGERKDSIQTWGDTVIDSEHLAVEVSADNTSRTIIDFEKETVTFEVLVDEGLEPKDITTLVSQHVEQAEQLESLLGSNLLSAVTYEELSERDLDYSNEKEKTALREILAQTNQQLQEMEKEVELLAETSGAEVDPKLVDQQKQELVDDALTRMQVLNNIYEKQRERVAEDSRSAKIMTYQVRMPSESLEKRIAPYLADIYKQSEAFDIEPALVLAIMHTESSFNSRARSPVPAFGLMQVVTTSAGHDVNRIVHKVDKPMNENDLYQPDYNIEAGTAYLDILNSRYLKHINDPQSREYCVIAAYNTGAGNVAKAFGERRLANAVEKINTLSPEDVYHTLINHLPYDETVNYLKKVTDRKAMYREEKGAV
ncbi:transglycosylase SLT domain-containing protein [Photobacterium rosenbergii]|nr:transglycosylase SLT domain-containing protein [Photobacterium rosenbergii]